MSPKFAALRACAVDLIVPLFVRGTLFFCKMNSYNSIYVDFFLFTITISLTRSNIHESTSIFSLFLFGFICAFPHLINTVSAYIESFYNCFCCTVFKFSFLIIFKQGLENSLPLIICQLFTLTQTFRFGSFHYFCFISFVRS